MTWLAVAGFEGLYSVSDDGLVLSVRRALCLSPVLDGRGYPTVRLYRNGQDRRYFVHRLVAEAFHGEKRNALRREVAHLDGNPLNARADNLKWVSPAENAYHKRFHGTHQARERHPLARLTEADVRLIRSSPLAGRALARRLGVNESAVRKIRKGERWKGAGPTAEGGDAQP